MHLKAVYRDGGLIDYHIDLPFQSKGIVLYPHFTDSITPAGLIKCLNHVKPILKIKLELY
jgi:hypothetical protein